MTIERYDDREIKGFCDYFFEFTDLMDYMTLKTLLTH